MDLETTGGGGGMKNMNNRIEEYKQVTYHGSNAHFPWAPGYRFNLHSRTRNFTISTVGEYCPGYRDQPVPFTKNGELYESKVIARIITDEYPNGRMMGIPEVREGATLERAEEGHVRLIEKYLKFEEHFANNPYPRWFSDLEVLLKRLSNETR